VAVNVTVRDIVNFPGGTAKTVTVDITQVVPVAGDPEGDEIWVSSATTTATASGGASIQNMYKNEMKRGFIKSSGLAASLLDIPSSYGLKVSIDEDISSGITIELASGNNKLQADIAQDIEDKIKAQALIGQGGAKAGNLSYLNVQVRVESGKYIIESGTLSDTYTGTGKSSVAVGAPDALTDARTLLGFDIPLSSETLASRQISETSLASSYSSGDILSVVSTAGFSSGDSLKVTDGTNSQVVMVSGAGVAGGLPASQIRFTTSSGVSTGLETSYSLGAMVRLMHEVDVSDPVSSTVTIDQLYRFMIDSMVNQIHFG